MSNRVRFSINGVGCEIGLDSTPDGKEVAKGTFILPNGEIVSIQGEATLHECAVLLRQQHPEVGFSLKGLWKGAKKLGGAIASGKVLSLAGKVLSKAAPMMLGPAGVAVGAALKAAGKLTAAKEYAARGNHAEANKLIASAAEDAQDPGTLQTAHAVSNKVYAMLLAPVAQQ